MPQTVTSYFTFVRKTPARSSEVNQNFNNYRGSILPINTDTQTSSDDTHDLGKNLKRFRTGYFGTSINIRDLTTTGTIAFQGQGLTTTTLNLFIDDTVACAWPEPQSVVVTATGSYGNLVIGATNLGDSTTGQNATSELGITTAAMRNTTLTIATTGRPIEYGIIAQLASGYLSALSALGYDPPGIRTGGGTSDQTIALVFLVRNGTTLPAFYSGWGDPNLDYSPASTYGIQVPPAGFKLYDLNPAQTTASIYYLSYRGFSTNHSFGWRQCVPYVREI